MTRFARAASFLAVAVMTSVVAHADTVTSIALPYNGPSGPGEVTGWKQWSDVTPYNGSQIAAAPTTGSTGTGITFSNYNGNFAEINAGSGFTILTDTALTGTSTVNTLMNLFYGSTEQIASVTFTNSALASDTFYLYGDGTIRDFNQSSYANETTSAGGVTVQEWWDNGASGQRLDVQSFLLPTSWAGTTLDSITIDDNATSNYDGEVVVSGIQVTSVTPEPSSLALLGTGVLGLAGMVRRRIGRKA